jgi:hypothetical protein
MKKTYLLILAAAALMLGACTHNTHFELDMPQDENPQKYPAPNGVGFLGNDLDWEDIADTESIIDHLSFTVTGSNGVMEKQEFSSAEDASEWMLPLPVGEYDVLVSANMDTMNGFMVSENLPTKADHTLPSIYAWLSDVSSNPDQVWHGITHVIVEKDKMTTSHTDLDRLLALFTLQIKNVPAGTVIDVKLRNAAEYVTLTEEYEPGHYGLPSKSISEDVTLGQLTADNALSAIDEFKVFPTATGLANTILLFHIKTNQGLELDYTGVAPAMENGCKYTLEMDYNVLNPYMLITASTTINEWTEQWAVSGEILDPIALK